MATPTTFKHSRQLATLLGRAVRSRLMPIAGIAVGVIVAGVGLFHLASPPAHRVPAGYVAVVNGKGVLMSDFIDQTSVEMQRPFDQTTHAQRLQVLKEMVNTELLVQRALVLDLPLTTVEVRDAMQDAVIAQVAAPVLANPVTNQQLEAYYLKHRARYTTGGTMLVHDLVMHIGGYQNIDQTLSQGKIDAAEAVYQLRAGASLAFVEEQFGLVLSGRTKDGQEFDFAAKIHLGPQLYQVATTLRDGQVSDPVVAPDGIHILVMERRQPPQLAKFTKAREKVYKDFQQAEIKRATDANLNRLRSRAEIIVAPGYQE